MAKPTYGAWVGWFVWGSAAGRRWVGFIHQINSVDSLNGSANDDGIMNTEFRIRSSISINPFCPEFQTGDSDYGIRWQAD